MKEYFMKYLKSIGMTETLQKRIATIYMFFEKVCPDEIVDIFVTDYIKVDMSREYENLWFFSEKYCMEAKQFKIKDNFDICPIKNKVYYWRLEKQDYDFKKATEQSRLNLQVHFVPQTFSAFKASRENCDYLRDIMLKFFVPNLRE